MSTLWLGLAQIINVGPFDFDGCRDEKFAFPAVVLATRCCERSSNSVRERHWVRDPLRFGPEFLCGPFENIGIFFFHSRKLSVRSSAAVISRVRQLSPSADRARETFQRLSEKVTKRTPLFFHEIPSSVPSRNKRIPFQLRR